MNKTQQDLEILEKLSITKNSFFNEISKVLIGQKTILEHIFISLLSEGHTLLVGVPGLAKTLLVQTLSEVLDLSFKRIQFTPDLMPSDITGTEIIDIDQNNLLYIENTPNDGFESYLIAADSEKVQVHFIGGEGQIPSWVLCEIGSEGICSFD